ncbi:MAG: hypothetical protein K8R59_09260 [Thermoanaerobaculales bacterium]|nr:hypothetical protein [Thermoanaerobaculales bacterium]
MRILLSFSLCVITAGCWNGGVDVGASRPLERRTVVWVDQTVDEDLAASLGRAGVSMLVVRRGAVDLSSQTPVLRISHAPLIAGEIPVASALRLDAKGTRLDPEIAEPLWQVLGSALGGTPAELVLDLPRLPEGTDDFIRRLTLISGLTVVPILTVEQLWTPSGVRVAQAAGTCVVPLYGPERAGLRGTEQMVTEPIAERLAPLVGSGVRVRPAVVLHPVTEPGLDHWGEGLVPLCDSGAAKISASSVLGRTFVLQRETFWSRRRWASGERIDVRWMDGSQLHSAFQEIGRLMLPEIDGWDLVSLPPSGDALGMGREGLIAYLDGRGPGPEIRIERSRTGRSLRVSLSNPSPFSSAVSNSGHWLEISIPKGALVVRERGDFDRMVLGSLRSGEWKQGIQGGVDAVRFGATFIGAFSRMSTGSIRLPSSGTSYEIRWRVVLSNGEVVSGALKK